MKPVSKQGFTLIELLTVVAIIAILAGIVSVALPRALERAKVTRVVANMRGVATALQNYFTDNQSYPLPYGYQSRVLNPGPSDPDYIPKLTSYLTDVGLYANTDIYDSFSIDYDTDKNGTLTRMEYSPLTAEGDGSVFAAPRGLVGKELSDSRPLVYLAVYSQHIERLRRHLENNGIVWDGETWPAGLDGFVNLPPPRLDEAVLISMGPSENTVGILTPSNEDAFIASYPTAAQRNDFQYYILALRAYYFATRDLNGNDLPDYDFRAQTRSDESANLLADFGPTAAYPPSGERDSYGPLIERLR